MEDQQLRRHWREVASGFLKLGALSYGGPAIMGLMQTEFQEKRGWLSKEHFLEGLSLVSMLPGAGATQLGIFIGHARAGWWGGLLGGLCFMLPAFFIMLILTFVYAEYGTLPHVRDVFYGVAPVVVGIFAVAVYRLGRTAVGDARQLLLLIAAALLSAFTPFGIVPTLLLAGSVGVMLYGNRRAGAIAAILVIALYALSRAAGGALGLTTLLVGHSGTANIGNIMLFFAGVGALTFGGGLSMIAFIQDQVVNQLHWLTSREFLDGLALGQLTPGPILMVAAFVGYKLAGVVGALAAATAIFLPSFVLMLSILPWVTYMKRWLWMRAALKGVMPAVIGLLLVALTGMVPAAVTDTFTTIVAAIAIVVLMLGRVGPLAPMLAGGTASLIGRMVR